VLQAMTACTFVTSWKIIVRYVMFPFVFFKFQSEDVCTTEINKIKCCKNHFILFHVRYADRISVILFQTYWYSGVHVKHAPMMLVFRLND